MVMPLSGNETEALPPTKRPFRTTKHYITKRFATKTSANEKNN